jgi:DNA-binding response OmpR family regulator
VRVLLVENHAKLAARAGKPLALSPKEFGVLERLLAAQGRYRI